MKLDEFEKEHKDALARISPNGFTQTITKLIKLARASKAEAGRMKCIGYPNPKFQALVDEVFNDNT